MAQAVRDWPKVHAGNRLQYTYDFANRLPAGHVIASVVWTLVVSPGAYYREDDPDPGSHIEDEEFTDTTVTCYLTGLVAGARYRLVAEITTDLGAEDDLYAHVSCDPGP